MPGGNQSEPHPSDTSSLGALTKRFAQTLEEAGEGCVDLNAAAASLNVQKRRIYDITNVLEGVGLIEKQGKNHVKWLRKNEPSEEESSEEAKLRSEIETLRQEEKRIDQAASSVQRYLEGLTEDPGTANLLWLSDSDIRSVPALKSATVLAIKAPQGTSAGIPSNDNSVRPLFLCGASRSWTNELFRLAPPLRETAGPEFAIAVASHLRLPRFQLAPIQRQASRGGKGQHYR